MTSPTARGVLSLEVAPRHVALSLADLQLAIADGTLILSRAVRRGVRRVVSPIRGRVVVARGLPREAVGLWHESAPGQVERVFGAEPRNLISADGLAALRQLDRLARRLGQAVADLGRGAKVALEIGPPGAHGLDKVLAIDDGHRLTVYRRSLFRQRAQRVLEATSDGEIIIATPRGDLRVPCRSRFCISVFGDYLRISTAAGDDRARVALPWIAREDRDELARRIGEVVERGAAPLALTPATGDAR
ncbi:MAG: hypothetical protein IPL61_14855 [Myxococcales bacterium]|nr:hypothetical protein [Myxococcales bacterium]